MPLSLITSWWLPHRCCAWHTNKNLKLKPDIACSVQCVILCHMCSNMCVTYVATRVQHNDLSLLFGAQHYKSPTYRLHLSLLYILLTYKNNKPFNKMIFSCKRVASENIGFHQQSAVAFLFNKWRRETKSICQYQQNLLFFCIYLFWICRVYYPKPDTVSITVNDLELKFNK